MVKPNHATENVLGTIGAVFWTIQIVPQIWHSYRTRSTHGLSAALMAIWSLSVLPFGAYIVAQKLSIPLQIQPHAFGVLCTISVAQCMVYGRKWSWKKTLCWMAVFYVVWAGFEVGSIYALWAGQDHGTDAPFTLYGILSAILLAIALLPQYIEIYRLKEVVGISLVFMAVDILGGLFSLLSLIFREKVDILACISYSLVVVLDGIVVILAFTLNPYTRRKRRLAQQAEDEEEESRIEGDRARVREHGSEGGHGVHISKSRQDGEEVVGGVGGAIGGTAMDDEEYEARDERRASGRTLTAEDTIASDNKTLVCSEAPGKSDGER